MIAGDVIAPGNLNNDGNSLTFGFASLFGSWPNSSDTDLATIVFDVAEGASGTTSLDIVETSKAAGFTFDGQSQDVVFSSPNLSPEPMTSQLSIDAVSGAVTLVGEADYQTVSNYMFTVTATNGIENASQDVGLLVADYLVSGAASEYLGTDEADVFALADGSAQVYSGDGEDIFMLAPSSQEDEDHGSTEVHTLVDFESGVDSIDASVALMALGYTGLSTSLDGSVQENKLSALTDFSDDILDLVDNNDASLNNAFGSYFDDASNVLTLFVDTDASQESHMIEIFEIGVGEGLIVEEDDLAVTLDAFIA
jgi:hypothetical protein